MEDLIEELVQVELGGPGWVTLAALPLGDEVTLDPVVLFDVVEQLDDRGVHRLVQVDVGSNHRVLLGQQELKADWAHLVRQVDWQLSAQHDDIVLLLACEADTHHGGLHSIVSLQKGVHVSL